eukprot:gene15950-18909_t
MADTSEAGEGENSQGDDDEGGDEEEAEGGDDEEDQAYERMNDGFNITNEEDGEREEKFDALGAELEEEESNDKKAVEKLAKKREEQLKELEVEKEAKKKDKKARQRNYFVYVLLQSTADIVKDYAGVRKKYAKGKVGDADKRVYFYLRKHKLAGAVQDPIVLTSNKIMIGGVWCLMRTNKELEEENTIWDLGKVDGDTIMFAMGGIAALNAINQQALKTKLK